ncbi:MAG: heparinase II/III domain-containing protein [Halanaerobiales bacterium]
MLSEKYNREELSNIIKDRENFHPFPRIKERKQWDFSEKEKERYIKEGEKYLNYDWPLLTATGYMDYARTGNRSRFQKLYFDRRYGLGSLTLAECLEGEGRFIDDIIDAIWLICEETSWVIPAHNNGVADNYDGSLPPAKKDQGIDLFAAETGALLSWTHYLLKDKLKKDNKRIIDRLHKEVQERIIEQYLKRDDIWWMGFERTPGHHINNWNPWCNSNCLTAFLLMEENEEKRLEGIEKVLDSLDIFLNLYPEDGGCDEGPSYWNKNGGSLFDCLELLYLASDKKINFYDNSLIQDIGKYIYRVHIDKDYFLNFADGNGRLTPSPELLHRFGKRLDNNKLKKFGAEFYHFTGEVVPLSKIYPFFRVLSGLFNSREVKTSEHGFPYVKDAWLPEIEVMAARENEESSSGLYLAAKGGHNNESHNHNDIGQFMVYKEGNPFIIDAGVETYTAKTFSSKRYEIWTMRSNYHNLPAVNGKEQFPGNEYQAKKVNYTSKDNEVNFNLDISQSYPESARINYWIRDFKFKRGKEKVIELKENFSLETEDNEIIWNIMSYIKPEITENSKILLSGDENTDLELSWDQKNMEAEFEKIELEDERLRNTWGDKIYRIQIKYNFQGKEREVKFEIK